MNILYSTGLTSVKFGGEERMILLFTKELSKRGHKIYVQYENLPDFGEFLSELKNAGGEAVVIPTKNRMLKGFFDIYRFIKEHNIDIVHSNFSPAKDLCVLAGRAAGVKKVISHFRNLETNKPRTGLRHWYKTHLSDVNIAISEAVKKDLIRQGTPVGSIKVIYVGVNIPPDTGGGDRMRSSIGSADDALVAMCIAWPDPVKGVDLLLKAFSSGVAPMLEKAELWIVGSVCDSDEYRRLAEDLGIEKRIKWLGVRSDVTEVLRGCDVYVQPSRSEAFSRAIAEAMAAGKPVAAFNVGGIPEVVKGGTTGILAPSENTVALADAIVRLLADQKLRHSMGLAGRERAQKMFSAEKEVEDIIKLYEGIN